MNNKNTPLVTVAIPTFNRKSLLGGAISSVLMQSYSNIEIIVSDNASSDGTADYIRSISSDKIIYIQNEINMGMVANWDCCLAKAKGDFFLLMSDDDALIDVDAVKKLVDCFLIQESTAHIGFSFSDVILQRDDGRVRECPIYNAGKCRTEDIIIDFFSKKLSLFPCAMLIRTDDIREMGGYSIFGAKLAVDVCLWLSLSFKYRLAYHIPESLAVYRLHHSQSSSSVEVWNFDYELIINLIDKYQNIFSRAIYKRIHLAVTSALARVPVGYIYRRYRDTAGYGVISALRDIIKYREKIFCWKNLRYFLKST